MAVSSHGEGPSEMRLPTMRDGAWFGEIGLLQQVPRTATVTAARDSRVLRISGEDFLAGLSDAPASTALLEGAQSRLARSHPGRRTEVPVVPLPAPRQPLETQADQPAPSEHD